MGQLPVHLPQAVTLSFHLNSPVFLSSLLAILSIGMLIMISFSSCKSDGLDNIGHSRAEGNSTAGRNMKP